MSGSLTDPAGRIAEARKSYEELRNHSQRLCDKVDEMQRTINDTPTSEAKA